MSVTRSPEKLVPEPLSTLPLCLPCLARQAIRLTALAQASPGMAERLTRELFSYLAVADYGLPAPVQTATFFRQIVQATGVADPFAEHKRISTELALKLVPDLQRRLQRSPAPFETAVRIAIAGNVIDMATRDRVDGDEMAAAIDETLCAPLDRELIEELEARAAVARHILYLADNAGEVVFDRPLLELLPADRLTMAVRGGPILNDATLADAQAAGLCDRFRVVANGAAVPGTWLPWCSEEFRALYAEADLIISKGQGNFETLWGRTTVPTWFLLRVKCEGIEVRVHQPVGTTMLLRG